MRDIVRFFLLIACSFATDFQPKSLMVRQNTKAKLNPFSLPLDRNLYKIFVRCHGAVGVKIHSSFSSASICDREFAGNARILNKWASTLSVTAETPDASVQMEYLITSTGSKSSRIITQSVFAPRKLALKFVEPTITLTKLNEKIILLALDESYLTEDSNLSLRPLGNWPLNLHLFAEKSAFYIYAEDLFKGQAPNKLVFEVVDKTSHLVTEQISVHLKIESELIQKKTAIAIEMIVFIFMFSALIGLVFFGLPIHIAKENNVPIKIAPVKLVRKEPEMNQSIEEWNKKVISDIKSDPHALSETQVSINDIEITDASMHRVSAIDLSRYVEDLSNE